LQLAYRGLTGVRAVEGMDNSVAVEIVKAVAAHRSMALMEVWPPRIDVLRMVSLFRLYFTAFATRFLRVYRVLLLRLEQCILSTILPLGIIRARHYPAIIDMQWS